METGGGDMKDLGGAGDDVYDIRSKRCVDYLDADQLIQTRDCTVNVRGGFAVRTIRHQERLQKTKDRDHQHVIEHDHLNSIGLTARYLRVKLPPSRLQAFKYKVINGRHHSRQHNYVACTQ